VRPPPGSAPGTSIQKLINIEIFPYYKKKRSLYIGLLSTRTLAFFFYRFVMVVRKNVLEYIIALVVKTGRNFSINLKEVIDIFIWTIELCLI
jgi:hypothetical protein